MEQKKKGIVSKVLKGIVIAILVVILILNVYVMIQAKSKPNEVPSIFGYKPFIVLSGSMENEIFVGDLVIVKKVDFDTLKENDIIAFRDDDNYVTTHRILNVVNTDKGKCFETKGDANNTKDEGVVCSGDIEGKYVKKIPVLGNVILFIQQPLGFICMMLSLFIICIFIYYVSNRNVTNKISDEELKEFEEFKKAKRLEKKEKEEKTEKKEKK